VVKYLNTKKIFNLAATDQE